MVDAQLGTGYSQLYNFTLQAEVAPSLTLEAGYVGSVSRSLPYAVGNLNRAGRQSRRADGEDRAGAAHTDDCR